MKTAWRWFWLVFVWLAGLPLNGDAAALWKVVKEPINRRGEHYRLFFADVSHGWVVGGDWWGHGDGVDSFVGYRTADGGRTWQEIHAPDIRGNEQGVLIDMFPEAQIYCVHAITSKELWIGSVEKIAYSKDGGETWELQFLRPRIAMTPEAQELLDQKILTITGIHFWNRQEGLLLGLVQWWKGDHMGSLMLATSDGGKTWQPIHVWQRWANTAMHLAMLPDGEGWMYRGGLYYTSDRGRTWKQVKLETSVYNVYSSPGGFTAAVVWEPETADPPNIIYSLNKGNTWNPALFQGKKDDLLVYFQRTPSKTLSLDAIAFAEERKGWAVGWGGAILKTENGIDWSLEESPTDRPLQEVQSIRGVVYAVGDGAIVLKRDMNPTAVETDGKLILTWGRLKVPSGNR